jgi:hypothetical protein
VNGSTEATPLKVIRHTVYHQKLWFARWITLHRRGQSWSVKYSISWIQNLKCLPNSLVNELCIPVIYSNDGRSVSFIISKNVYQGWSPSLQSKHEIIKQNNHFSLKADQNKILVEPIDAPGYFIDAGMVLMSYVAKLKGHNSVNTNYHLLPCSYYVHCS